MAEYMETNESIETRTSRIMLYKKPISKDNVKLQASYEETGQEIRRKEFLSLQKRNREIAFNTIRKILGEYCNSEEEEKMDIDVNEKRINCSKYRRHHYYENYLMLSEWMLEVPQDLMEKWICVPCPKGRRTLLVARKGKTKAYTRRGQELATFASALPGGGPLDYSTHHSILDCIWIHKDKTYYVLDVLSWSNQTFLNCDTEFRFFWIKTQLEQNPIMQMRDKSTNAFPILHLPRVSCDSDLSTFLVNLPDNFKSLDGILFYHRETHYTQGRTPLVTWLKPFMLPEVLGVSVSSPLDEKPDDYIDFEHFMSKRSKFMTKNQE